MLSFLHYSPLQSYSGNFYIAIQAVIVPCREIPKTALITLALLLVTSEPPWCRDQPLIMYSHRQTIKVKSKACCCCEFLC